jgi:hypothetical protein
MPVASQECRLASYSHRRPESTTLYQVVQEHLGTYVALAPEGDWAGQRVPAYVEREIRHYLVYGILAYGSGVTD